MRRDLPFWMACNRCGKQFQAQRKTRKFCSSKCKYADLYDRRLRSPILQAACKNCGKPFVTNKSFQKFCGAECRNKWYRERYRKDYEKVNSEKRIQARKERYRRNKDEIKQKVKEYYQRNRKTRIAQKLEYKRANKDKINKKQKARHNGSVKRRIEASISALIRRSIKDKKRRSWESIVEYTLTELMTHLESQFVDGMTWTNYGEWQIDHIKPRSLFWYESSTDLEFKKCWALSNLQPLWAGDNIRKRANYDG